MKSNTAKRAICILLCMLMALATPLSALAIELNSVPVIYVGEMSDNALYENPNKTDSKAVYDAQSSDFSGNLTKIVSGILMSDFSDVATNIPNVATGIKGIMDPILCDKNGNSVNPDVGAWQYTEPISAYKEDIIITDNIKGFAAAAAGYVSTDEIFFFSYDWRLDPTSAADNLKKFIDHVESVTGKSNVAILSVGYGGVITNSYLYRHSSHAAANVTSTVFYDCPILGSALIGDFMTGKIVRTSEDHSSFFDDTKEISGEFRGDAFMAFLTDDSTGLINNIGTNILGDSAITTLLMRIALLFGISISNSQDVHKDLGKSYNKFASNADAIIYNDFLKEYLRNMPGLWALVPEEDLAAASEFLFSDATLTPELNAKILAYREVLRNTADTFLKAKNNGINVCVVAGYDYQLLPVTASIEDVSDGIESVKYSSAGAVTTDNSTEPNHLLYCLNDNHSHVSPDKDIDASYCILPENTWFLKDVPHGDMTKEPVATFIVWLLFGFAQRHIRENVNYTQFMTYSDYSKKLSPYTTPGDEFSTPMTGDIDYSGAVDAADARLALRIAVNLENANKETKILADADNDGNVTAADARLILRFAVGLEVKLPA